MIKFQEGADNNQAFINISNISSHTKESIRQAFYFIGKDLRQEAQDSIADKNKSGRTYIVRLGRIKKTHQASAPGEAPANLTGNLRKSIGFEVRGGEQLEFGSRNGPPAAGVSPKQAVADYSKFLELGTSKMAARPYLKPAIKNNEKNAYQHFETQLKRLLNNES